MPGTAARRKVAFRDDGYGHKSAFDHPATGLSRRTQSQHATQSFDIFPTILDYENIKLHYAQFGVSLRPQVEGPRRF